jgi:hypothetical protein
VAFPHGKVSRYVRALAGEFGSEKKTFLLLPGWKLKVGKALTMFNLEAVIEDRDLEPNERASINPSLNRSHSWTAGDSN